jgi:cytochrome oxidase Cu insertion factor (SCO1/SenC/PrrC family)
MRLTARLAKVFARIAALFVFLGACAGARAATAPVPEGRGAVPDVLVWNENDQQIHLSEITKAWGTDPVVILPAYTRCLGSCPTLALKLKVELARVDSGLAYHVIIFSFDPAETTENLQRFREHEGLPTEWMAVHSDEMEIRKLFGFFDYAVMKQSGALIHPNEMFLLSGENQHGNDLFWRESLPGVDWSSQDIEKAFSEMRSPTVLGQLRANPGRLIKAGFAGLLASMAVVLGCLVFRRATHTAPQH